MNPFERGEEKAFIVKSVAQNGVVDTGATTTLARTWDTVGLRLDPRKRSGNGIVPSRRHLTAEQVGDPTSPTRFVAAVDGLEREGRIPLRP